MVTIFLLLAAEPAPIPIVNMFDECGEPTDEWEDANTFVAGPLANGSWVAGLTCEYREAVLH